MNAPTPPHALLKDAPDPGATDDLALDLGPLIDRTQQLIDAGRATEAHELYRRWMGVSTHPARYVASFNHGALLQQLGLVSEAVEAYDACIELAPNFGHAYVNLGLLHEKQGRPEQALEVWSRYVARRLLRQQVDEEMLCTAYNHIGRVHEEHKQYDLAEAALRESLKIKPRQPGVIQHWVHIRQKSCAWPVYDQLPGVSLSEQIRYTSPLAMLALTDDPVRQLLSSQSFVQRTYGLREEHLHKQYPRDHVRRRIGIVSGDLREHAVGFLLPSFLRQFDRSGCDLYAYDFSKQEETPTRRQILAAFDVVRPINALNDQQAAELIAGDGIDILIDLHGLSSGARPGIFARHPAPSQGTYLGFIGPTGMPWLDFVIADRHVLPPELATHFTERPVYMEGSFIPLSREAGSPLQATRAEAGLPEQGFVMAAFGNVYKITPEMFDTWLRLLRRIDGSVLWLLHDNDVTTGNLRKHAQDFGVDASRIVFAGRTSPDVFRSRLALADVYLDTYPYNCGSTSNDVINAGVPLVTMYGETMVSRMGLSILHEVNQADFATTSFSEYEDKVVEVWLGGRHGLDRRFSMTVKPSFNSVISQINRSPDRPWSTDACAESSPPRVRVRIRELAAHDVPGGLQSWERSLASGIRMESVPGIASVLLESAADKTTFHGFLGSAFVTETGLSFADVESFAASHGTEADILLFNPHWDSASVHPTPIHLAETRHPGSLALMQGFADAAGLDIDLANAVLATERSVLGNHWLAKRSVWIHWLELARRWNDVAGEPTSALHGLMRTEWRHHSGLTAAQLLFPLLMNLLLLKRPLRVACKVVNADADALLFPSPKSPVNASDALMRSALKQAWLSTGWSVYREALFDGAKAP